MPYSPLGPCRVSGCPNRADCPIHPRAVQQPAPDRPSAAKQGYGRKWQAARAAFLKAHPYCACGCGRLSETVDHITPHRGDRTLFWDRKNWQAMAKVCHDRKTVLHDGGFGRARVTR